MSPFRTLECFWRRQQFKYHPILGWTFIPNIRARIPHDNTFYLIRTNDLGFRCDRNYSLLNRSSRKRIILLGDSYTAGDGVSNGQRYSDYLENDYPNLDVINFGLPNSGTDQQLLIFETIAGKFQADAYVFGILVENIVRNKHTCRPAWDVQSHEIMYRPKPYFTICGNDLSLCHTPVPREKRKEGNLGDWSYEHPYSGDPKDPYAFYTSSDGRFWQLMKKILIRFLKQTGDTPVYLMPLPMFNYFLDDIEPRYLDRFRELEDKNAKRYVVDVLPEFMALDYNIRENCRFTEDPHYTPLGHQIVARALAKAIEKHNPELLEK